MIVCKVGNLFIQVKKHVVICDAPNGDHRKADDVKLLNPFSDRRIPIKSMHSIQPRDDPQNKEVAKKFIEDASNYLVIPQSKANNF